MGCFNAKCVVSKTIITEGDEIALIFFDNNNTPFGPPIFGKYNDYGSIENIQKNLYNKYYQEYFQLPITKIVEILVNAQNKPYSLRSPMIHYMPNDLQQLIYKNFSTIKSLNDNDKNILQKYISLDSLSQDELNDTIYNLFQKNTTILKNLPGFFKEHQDIYLYIKNIQFSMIHKNVYKYILKKQKHGFSKDTYLLDTYLFIKNKKTIENTILEELKEITLGNLTKEEKEKVESLIAQRTQFNLIHTLYKLNLPKNPIFQYIIQDNLFNVAIDINKLQCYFNIVLHSHFNGQITWAGQDRNYKQEFNEIERVLNIVKHLRNIK
jgi:hypothetical protein